MYSYLRTITLLTSALVSSVAVGELTLRESDAIVANAHPAVMRSIVSRIGHPDSQGLIGRNRQWGKLHSVRFQYGAGRALRFGSVTNDANIERLAIQAIQAGLDVVSSDGVIPATLPAHLADQYDLGPSDQASAAAFFLSDVCVAFALTGATSGQRMTIRSAAEWLAGNHRRLMYKDRRAPNRLLIDAVAFLGCARLLEDTEFAMLADPFIDAALKFAQPDGVFLEAGGSDTSYQAVSLVAISDLLNLGYDGEYAASLRLAYRRGVDWLRDRVQSDGQLDSSGNTRTCANEAFLGKTKLVDVREVARALAYAEANLDTKFARFPSFIEWVSNARDPCH